MGVPDNYGTFLTPPAYLQLPEGVAQTNYRNEYEWGLGWYLYGGKPANAHWNHTAAGTADWDIDLDGYMRDSRRSCVTCHNPHGARRSDGRPTVARTMADLEITFDIYNDGTMDREYSYIGSGAYLDPVGDLHCMPCHTYFGPGDDPPDPGDHTRIYREWLDLSEDGARTSEGQ